METSASAVAAVGVLVPLAHFAYTLVRDLRRARRGKPNVRVFATIRNHPNRIGVAVPMKCVCVVNVSSRAVSVAEIRTSPERGVGVVAIGGVQGDIAPGCAISFPLPFGDGLSARPYCGDVFVELGTGEVFSAAV